MMFVRKKTKIAFAYGVLAASALSVTAYDACLRDAPLPPRTQTGRVASAESAAPLGISPLAESPFPEARPKRFDASAPVLAHDESTPMPKRQKHAPPPGIYFLTVAVQVDSGEGSVSFHPGTRVRLIRQQDGKLLVTRNGTDFLIEKSQVTDDLNVLASLARGSS